MDVTKIKEVLLSDTGMKIVNVLFLAALLARNTGFILVAYSVWILYLMVGIRYAESQATKIIHTVCIAFAACMIAVNLFFLFNSLR